MRELTANVKKMIEFAMHDAKRSTLEKVANAFSLAAVIFLFLCSIRIRQQSLVRFENEDSCGVFFLHSSLWPAAGGCDWHAMIP